MKKSHQQSGPLETISIRDVTEADFDLVRGLYDSSLRKNERGFKQSIPQRPLQDIGEFCCEVQSANGAMRGVFTGAGKLIGFGCLCRNKKSDDRVELCKLHLDVNYQGRGLGRQLVESLIDLAADKGYKTIELHVTATQTAALGLYVRLGFVQTERKLVTTQFGETFDTIYMERPVVKSID